MKDSQKVSPGKWIYLFIFAVIYFSQDTLLFGTNKEEIYDTILYVSLPVIILVVFVFGYFHQIVVKRGVFVCMTAMIVVSLATQLLTESGMNPKYFYECLMYVLAFLICAVVPIDQFKRAFVDIVSVLALISAVVFAVNYVYPSIKYPFPVIVNDSDYYFAFMGLTTIPYQLLYVPLRNFGIFREPGVYQIFLNLAVMFLLEDKKQHKNWKLYAILIALVFTYSTAGYIICALIIILNFVTGKLRFTPKIAVQLVAVLAVVVSLFVSGVFKFDINIFTKLTNGSSSSDSRFGSILVGLYLGMISPLVGHGFAHVEENFALVALEKFRLQNMHNTNTVLKMFAVHGLLQPVLFMAGLIFFCRKHMDRRLWSGYFIVIMLMLSVEDMMFNTMSYILMFYGFVDAAAAVERYEIRSN